MRQHVTPANPNTVAQQRVRSEFAFMREMWKLAPSGILATWNAFAEGRPFTGMNKFVGENIRVIDGQTDMNNFIGSPGSRGGLPPVSFAAATGVNPGEITWTMTPPTIPSGWAIQSAVAVAFPDADPTGIFSGPFVQDIDVSSTYGGVLAGLGSAVLCQVSGWLVWTKPDGKLAYSVSLLDQATSDA